MTRTTLLALASRVEAATATEQREMLEAAFVAVHGPKPERVHGGSPEWIAWLDMHNPFFALLQAGGFLDAAMSLAKDDDRSELLNEAMEAVSLNGWKDGEYLQELIRAFVAASLRAIAGSLPD